MDPITLGILAAIGAGGAAAAARWRKARNKAANVEAAAKRDARDPARPMVADGDARRTPRVQAGEHRVGEVLLYMGDEYWLAGELALLREGAAAVRLYAAPERGADRWLAFPREGDSVFVLRADPKLAAMGWPGTEVPFNGLVLRPVEQGSCAIAPSGEVEQRWEGVGRYAIYRTMDSVALVVEQSAQRLALTGKAIPRRLLEKLG